jgi:hypothetical protein
MKRNLLFLLLFLSVQLIYGQIIHIPADYPTIQEGIDAAVPDDTILVDNGEYFENLNLHGKNIVLCSNFALTGDLNDIMTTIINGSTPVYPDTASCVLIVSGEDSTAVVQGFTITGGNGTKWEDEHGPGNFYTEGGGILIQYSSLTIKNNIIRNNKATQYGSGIVSAGGGAIRCGDGNPHIINNLMVYNQGRYGGGLVLNYSGAVIKNNIFAWNTGGQDFGGGGLWILSNGTHLIIIENNTIVNNHSTLGGGGIRLWSAVAQITNNILWGNTANTAPQIQGNTGTVTYCCVQGGYTGSGNIDTDPQFYNSDFLLDVQSDCVDSGNPDAAYYDPEDIQNPGFALYPAWGIITNDMGAFGGPGCLTLPEIITAIHDFEPSVNQQVMVSILPAANHHFDLLSLVDYPVKASVTVCDIQGRILTESDLKLEAFGTAGIAMGSDNTGLYLVRIQYSNGVQQTERLLLP